MKLYKRRKGREAYSINFQEFFYRSMNKNLTRTGIVTLKHLTEDITNEAKASGKDIELK